MGSSTAQGGADSTLEASPTGALGSSAATTEGSDARAVDEPAGNLDGATLELTPVVERTSDGPRSEALPCGLWNPMPGGITAGYAADTGLDIAGMGLPVFALGPGSVEYAEAGHSLWNRPGDTDMAVLLELDEPIAYEGRRVTHVWYAHLAELAFEQPDARLGGVKRRRVSGGEYLGKSGRANGMYHLHLGLLLDGQTRQRGDDFLLEDEVRAVLCKLRHKSRLPALSSSPATSLAPARTPAPGRSS